MAAICCLPVQGAHSQTYPSKPIRLVVPYAPGGSNDNVARPLAQSLTNQLGVQVIIDNRGGGGTTIGSALVARAAPDGYTLLLCSIASHAISPQLYAQVPYDPLKDFEPITQIVSAPILLVTYPRFSADSVQALVALAKANPGKLTYASGGNGSSSHLAAELFKSLAGIDLLHVPFKGGGAAVTAMLAERVDLQFPSAAAYLNYVKDGRLKALAIARKARWPTLSNVPTFAEAGWPAYSSENWFGLCAPARTPKAIADRLQQETASALHAPQLSERFRAMVTDSVGSTPREFAAFMRAEYEKYGRIIKSLGLRVD
jgi:tripartite-type tricarboxylate transporter receptor subunit TctC